MSKKTFAFMAIPALTAIMFVGAFAPMAMAEAADVQKNDGCNSSNAVNAGLDVGTFTPVGQTEVHTNNGKGTATFTCHGVLDDLEKAPDRALRGVLDPCNFTNPVTGETVNGSGMVTVTPSGQVSVICHS